MRALLKQNLIVLIPEPGDDATALADWTAGHADHVFAARSEHDARVLLHDLGSRPVACREPINIGSWVQDEELRLISNLAHTPFDLDGRPYASVEGFWQGLKFPKDADRRRMAKLHGQDARRAGQDAPAADTFEYEGEMVRVGTFHHWERMRRACLAKFTQHAEAYAALLSTGDRPLEHRLRHDSRNIPGVIMADIWMRVRALLVRRATAGYVTSPEDDV